LAAVLALARPRSIVGGSFHEVSIRPAPTFGGRGC
jgi:hypothetical protein